MTRPDPTRLLPLGLALLGLLLPVAAVGQGLHQALSVRLEPATRLLAVEATLTAQDMPTLELALDRRYRVEAATLDGRPLTALPSAHGPWNRWRIPLDPGGPRVLRLRYQGRLEPPPDADHRQVLSGLPPMAGPRGSFLSGGTGWHPTVGDTPFTYRLSLDLPADQRGLVPGRLVAEREAEGRYQAEFDFAHPIPEIDLIAGPYRIRERLHPRPEGEPIRLRAYFHPEVADLAEGYLAAAGDHLERFGRQIGAYPFGEFSVVSSLLPTGFGMPTLTYLGIDVLRLPFIRATSLGHEVLHSWWGNGVYVDYGRGNWSEGLTTFLADYAAREREGAAASRELRLTWLRDFAAVPPGGDPPLRRFTGRTHGTSQVVGYHKSAFLFLMLADRIGREAFDAGLRRFWDRHRFRRAGWADLRRAFEEAAGQGLADFFAAWLERPGAPALRIASTRVEPAGAGHRLRLTLEQSAPPYPLRVPLVVTTDAGELRRELEFSEPRREFSLELPDRPRAAALDPDLRLFRRLDPAELPPILRQVILDPRTRTLVPGADPGLREAAARLAARLLDHPAPIPRGDQAPEGLPLLVIGLSREVEGWLARRGLPGVPEELRGRGTARVWAASRPDGSAMVLVAARDREALLDLLRPLPHYGRQSYLVFEGATAVDRGIWPSARPTWLLGPAE